MSQVTYACASPGCRYTQESPSKTVASDEVADERVVHATEHANERGFYVTERWPWLVPLTIVNVVTLILSTVALIGGVDVILLGMIFPQVWGWTVVPIVGVFTLTVVLIAAHTYALKVPKGANFARRLYAGVTMGAFIAALIFPVVTVVLFAMVSAAFS